MFHFVTSLFFPFLYNFIVPYWLVADCSRFMYGFSFVSFVGILGVYYILYVLHYLYILINPINNILSLNVKIYNMVQRRLNNVLLEMLRKS